MWGGEGGIVREMDRGGEGDFEIWNVISRRRYCLALSWCCCVFRHTMGASTVDRCIQTLAGIGDA